jgi:hypothetical protein
LCRQRNSERGEGLIELAVVLPFVLVLMLAILDFGLATDRRGTLHQALREGARAAAAGESAEVVKSRIVDESQDLLESTDVSVCYLDGPDPGTAVGGRGDGVSVSIEYEFNVVLASELLDAFGAGVPPISISPQAEALLLKDVPGAVAC